MNHGQGYQDVSVTQSDRELNEATTPIVVDLDGTLVRSDLLIESLLILLHTSILYLWWLPVWLLRGKASLKHEIAQRVDINAATLPYNQALVDFLESARKRGHTLVLATASNVKFANGVADHLGLFSEVIASDETVNLAGQRKLDALRERFGDHGYDYVANGRVDLIIWRHARRAILVGANARVSAAAAQTAQVEQVFAREPISLRSYLQELRLHQWLKNVLLFVPLIAAHQFTDPGALLQVLIGVIAFCLCASSVYLLNDLLDLQDDRRHPRKHLRPLASGAIPLAHAVALIPFLLLASILAASALPATFLAVLAGYYVLTLAYSLGLKRVAIIDVLVLASLYTTRIIAGGAAAAIELSFWLLAFSVFLFLSLALAKRCAELVAMQDKGRTKASGRGYLTDDLTLLYSLGGASGYVAVLVLALYINSPQIALSYSRPELIWVLCLMLLYWVSRVWLETFRGNMHDDPVVFAARDTGSRIILIAGAVILWLAI